MGTAEDHHVHCFDVYSLHHSYEPHTSNGPFDAFCRVPVDKGHGRAVSPTVYVLKGIEALDLYSTSSTSEIWKNGAVAPCIVPDKVRGWEFYSLLWTKPDGTSPLSLGDSVELLIGRPPGAAACPSLLFAFVPRGTSYLEEGINRGPDSGNHPYRSPAVAAASLPPPPPAALQAAQANALQNGAAARPAGKPPKTAYEAEHEVRNLDSRGCTILARLLVLAPIATFKDQSSLPDDPHWGLYIGPRSRSLVLLNKQRGRIDLNLATILALDGVFWHGATLVKATSRLFNVFGTSHKVPELFSDMDPLKLHSAFTSATHADHVSVTLDGRKDYMYCFGGRLPTFFVSNSSDNLCYLTPQEAQRHRKGEKHSDSGEEINLPTLPDLPVWTLLGKMTEEQKHSLLTYRQRNPAHDSGAVQHGRGGWLSLLDWCGVHHLSAATRGDDAEALPAPAALPALEAGPPKSPRVPKQVAFGGTFGVGGGADLSSIPTPGQISEGGDGSVGSGPA
eukprot:TRINITY_DN11820_c0_g1_i1.p1 TRINITY_DN11820_c0_g1~~TRINITY_DN11820_c0_g1_i1.p1  ORF type:complete len:505 (-),score=90.45 TRINITY_DN11820_c0_g1_i1:224-1738(-)